MNAIQLRERIDEIIDRTRTARQKDRNYYSSINAAINMIVKDRVEAIRIKRNYSIQSSQRLRDELYTLIPDPTTGVPSNGVVPFPATYFYYLLLYVTIGGEKQYCIPTDYNTVGPLLKNPFSKPSSVKPYFNENASGLNIYSNDSTLSSYELWYIKKPATVSIGEERDKIITGGTLTNLIIYYVYDQSVYGGVTYYPGEMITGTGATLTSGTVISSAKVTNCDLPDSMHEEVCKVAADLILGNVSDLQKASYLNNQIERN